MGLACQRDGNSNERMDKIIGMHYLGQCEAAGGKGTGCRIMLYCNILRDAKLW
jgi:hypothetical protein